MIGMFGLPEEMKGRRNSSGTDLALDHYFLTGAAESGRSGVEEETCECLLPEALSRRVGN